MNLPENAGIIFRRFCGIPIDRDEETGALIACSNEATGELTVVIDGEEIAVPICGLCLFRIMQEREVDTNGAVLLD